MELPWWDRPHRRETTTGRLHECFHLLGVQALVKHPQELAQHWAVGLRKEFLGCWCQTVDIGRLAAATTDAALLYQPVTLQERELSADGIVSEVERLGQLFH